MISLRKAANEMERQEDLLRALVQIYAQAIRASAEYAVEIDANSVDNFREHLRALHEQSSGATTPQQFEAVDKSLRRELQDYQNGARTQLNRMHRELEGAASAMKSFAGDVSGSSADYEVQLKREVRRLTDLSNSDDLEEIRSGVRASADEIAQSCDRLRRSTQLTIAQLKDEIRVLHQSLESSQQKRSLDQGSGAWNRQKITERMDALQEQNQTFCVMVVVLRNWKRIQAQYPRAAVTSVLQAALKDLRGILGGDVVVGRWSDEVFLALVEGASATAMGMSSEVKRRWPGAYSVQEGGVSHTLKLDTAAGIVERQKDTDAARFSLKLKQLMEALGSAG